MSRYAFYSTILCFFITSVLSAQVADAIGGDTWTRHHGIKTSFLSPATNYCVEVSYEVGLKKNRNLEVGLGYIGLGDNPDVMYAENVSYIGAQGTPGSQVNYNPVDFESAKGAFGRVSYKFMNFLESEFANDSKHPFTGEYIETELTIGSYGVDAWRIGDNDLLEQGRYVNGFGSFTINIGAQGVLADILLFDLYLGAGYGTETARDYVGNHAFFLGEQTDGFGLCLRGGVNLGILLN